MNFKLKHARTGAVLSENNGVYTIERGDDIKSTSDRLTAVAWFWDRPSAEWEALDAMTWAEPPEWAHWLCPGANGSVECMSHRPPNPLQLMKGKGLRYQGRSWASKVIVTAPNVSHPYEALVEIIR